jgi:hypothetical protein
VKLRSEVILERLEALGLVHRSVQFQMEGDYLPADVDWNYKDVVHRNTVHSRIEDLACVVERDLQASISYQKVLGVPFPLVLVHYDTGPGRQTHFLTVLAWTMVTDHEFVEISPGRTRATTTYTVASKRLWMLAWPLIRWLLRRNYTTLMSEDVPMRERRGRLRKWGYRFLGDGEGPRDLRRTISVAMDNLVVPDPPADPPMLDPVPLATLREGERVAVGRSDHLGLLLERGGDTVTALRRMCPHEGAELDGAAVVDGCQVCPWHGRRLEPLAVLDLDAPEPVADTAWHHLAVVDAEVHVSVIPGRTTPAAPHGAAVPADT